MEFYTPSILRRQSENNRQASFFDPEFDGKELREEIRRHNEASLKLYERLIASGVCREQARGVLPQNMMVTFWGTVDLANLLHFLDLRDSDHAQAEIREYAADSECGRLFREAGAGVVRWRFRSRSLR